VTQVINWPGIADSLQRALGLKGSVKPTLDETLAPTVQLEDIGHSPWSSSISVAGNASQGGILGELSQLLITPGRGTVLRIDRVWMQNVNGPTTSQRVFVLLTPPSDYTTYTLGVVRNFSNLKAPFQGSALDAHVVAGTIQLSTNPAALGRLIGQFSIDPESQFECNFSDNGVFLDGSVLDASGLPGVLSFAASTDNQQLNLTVFGREYFIRG